MESHFGTATFIQVKQLPKRRISGSCLPDGNKSMLNPNGQPFLGTVTVLTNVNNFG